MELFKLITEILFILVGLYFILFKSYFKKKGENIATKEDIGEITKEIEKIKNEFSFKNQKEIDLFIERKKNLINFYDSYFIWAKSISIIDFLISFSNDKKVLRELITELKSEQTKVFTYFSRIFLYDVNTEFTKSLNKIYNETVIAHNTTLRFLLDFEQIAIKHEKIIEKSKVVNNQSEENILITELSSLKLERDTKLENHLNEEDEFNKGLDKNKLLVVKIIRKEIKTGYA